MQGLKHKKNKMLLIGNYLVMLIIIMLNVYESSTKPTEVGQSLPKIAQSVKLIKNEPKTKVTNFLKSKRYPSQDEKFTKRSINIRKRRQLDQLLKLAAIKTTERNASIEKLKDDSLFPVLRVTPISLLELGYYPDEEEVFYEEDMDELLKLRKKLHILSNHNKRGDMNPIMEYYDNMQSSDDKVPVRGDLVTRNKRSSNNYDEYWGFGEDEGITFSDESNESNEAADNYLSNNNVNLAEYKRNYETRNPPNPSDVQLQMELDQKLKDYIARNRPIVPGNRNKPDKDHSQTQARDLKPENEIKRLNNLPVSAQIIILKNVSRGLDYRHLEPRGNFETEIDFPGINPNRGGLEATHFPSAARVTPKPRGEPPSACIWAIVHCCTSNSNRLTRCFEHMGCPGVNWDPDPCRRAVADAARAEIVKYYANTG